MISVNQLSIYGTVADLCKELNENSAEDSSEDSESSNKLDTEEGPNEMETFMRECLKIQDDRLAETRQHQQRQQRSAIRKRRKLRLLCRSENWMAVLQGATGKPLAASSSSTSQWQDSQWQASWSSWQSTSSEIWW